MADCLHAPEMRARIWPKSLIIIYLMILAGVVGFEPTVRGTKNRCLTTWLHPNDVACHTTPFCRVQAQTTQKIFKTSIAPA